MSLGISFLRQTRRIELYACLIHCLVGRFAIGRIQAKPCFEVEPILGAQPDGKFGEEFGDRPSWRVRGQRARTGGEIGDRSIESSREGEWLGTGAINEFPGRCHKVIYWAFQAGIIRAEYGWDRPVLDPFPHENAIFSTEKPESAVEESLIDR